MTTRELVSNIIFYRKCPEKKSNSALMRAGWASWGMQRRARAR